MKESGQDKKGVLLVGSNKFTYSIALCLLGAGHPVVLVTQDCESAINYFQLYTTDNLHGREQEKLKITSDLHFEDRISMVIAVTKEDLLVKRELIESLEKVIPMDVLIAINTESFPLSDLQIGASAPERILGANWVEPANTTFFLEIIANRTTRQSLVDYFYDSAAGSWGKDPYVIHGDSGIRMRLLAAMIREAFYLIKNDYANVEDIDRACRNDAGYYLPFAGNLRYMDLMGTYAYGMVMKDLNPELAKDQDAPAFFNTMIKNGQLGMESGTGFYGYQPGEREKWEVLLNRFSHQIGDLIEKYPFNYKTEEPDIDISALHSENRL